MTKTKIKYRIKKNKNIKREYDNTFEKKVVALAMKILRMSKNEMQSQNFVDKLNNYILNNSKGWTKWVLGETGYPIFEL